MAMKHSLPLLTVLLLVSPVPHSLAWDYDFDLKNQTSPPGSLLFESVESIPVELVSTYICSIFGPTNTMENTMGGSSTPRVKNPKGTISQWFSNLEEWVSGKGKKKSLKNKFEIMQQIRDQLQAGYTPAELKELEDILTEDLALSDVKLIAEFVYGDKMSLASEAVAYVRGFYAKDAKSSAAGLTDEDAKRMLIDLVLTANGHIRRDWFDVDFADSKDVLENVFLRLLPDGMSAEQKTKAVEGMLYLVNANLTIESTNLLFQHIVHDIMTDTDENTLGGDDDDGTDASYISLWQTSANGGNIDKKRVCRQLQKKSSSPSCGENVSANILYSKLQCSDGKKLESPPLTLTSLKKTTVQCGRNNVLLAQVRKVKSNNTFGGRVVGGVAVGTCATYPWMVHLTVNDGDVCGGVILDERHILTAGHCVHEKDKMKATIGEYDSDVVEGTEQVFEIDPKVDATSHPKFHFYARRHDLAVLKLKKDIDFSKTCATPICYDPTYTVKRGQNCTIAGWGATSERQRVATKRLQAASIPTYVGQDCLDVFDEAGKGYFSDINNQLCAGNHVTGGVDACGGDSGGPLVCLDESNARYVLVGVTSYGEGCARAYYPGVYANTAHYERWIEEMLRL